MRSNPFILAGAFLTALCSSSLVAQQQFQVTKLNLTSTARATRTSFDYTYRVDVHNTGAAATGLTAIVKSTSPNTTIVDGDLAFGDVAAGQTISSSDTFKLRQNRLVPFNPAALSFQFVTNPMPNMPPIADAGEDQTARAGDTVQLDGSKSRDLDGSIAGYSWTFAGSIPAGLPASLSDPHAAKPTVLISSAGTYTFRLVVTDNQGLSSKTFDEVKIKTGPVANAGADQTVQVGETVQLDGSGSSDPESLPLTYSWTLVSKPPGSKAKLSDPTAQKPTFVADVAGSYSAELVVNNGVVSSEPDTVAITAVEEPFGCGALISGSIGAAAEVDNYPFQGQANRIITLTLAKTGGFGPFALQVPVATLYAPSGEAVVSFSGNDQRQVTLSTAGTYVIQVRAGDFASTGKYNLGLQCRNPATEGTPEISCGALPSGNLAKSAQVDQYTFEGQANRIITLTLAKTGGFGPFALQVPVATLYAPSGEAVVSFAGNDQRQVTLSAAGTYVIQVRAGDFANTGKYNLGLECRNPAAQVNAAIGCGALPSGNLAKSAQVDQYTFEGQANRIVTLTLAETSDFGSFALQVPVATLYAPSGEAVVSFAGNDQRQVTLSTAGTYVTQVRAGDFASTGTYNLGLACP
jgi:PKD repeat protein